MRKELELIEQIENYLLGKLSKNEQVLFENRIHSSETLRKKVKIQRSIVEGVERMGLKNAANNAKVKFKRQKLVKKLLVGGVLVAGLLGAASLIADGFQANGDEKKEDQSEVLSQIISFPKNDSLSANANQYLNQEVFRVKTNQDTLIESEDGLLVFIEENTFDTEEEEVDFMIQTALTAEDVLMSGLSTTSNGQPLETGGMFYLDAFDDNGRVDVMKDMHVNVPTDEKKADMMLFNGEVGSDGEVNWVKPEKIINYLNPVEILTLDFYPPGYENKLDEMGLYGKEFRDSLYYSFAYEQNLWASEILIDEEVSEIVDDLLSSNVDVYDSIAYTYFRGVNPASVHTIWSERFNNSLLSTKEFEQRMPWIHKSCDDEVLKMYIRNNNQDMWYCDMKAARMTSGQVAMKFQEFADLKDGRVRTSLATTALWKHFERKRKKAIEKINKEQEDYWDNQSVKDSENESARLTSDTRSNENESEILRDEISFNLRNTYKKLDMQMEIPLSYNVSVSGLGWNNIDRKIIELTVARESGTIVANGKTAEIVYEEWSAQVDNVADYDRVYVYNIPKTFSSYIKISAKNNRYSYKLNKDVDYQTLILGWDESSIYFHQDKKTLPGEHFISLKAITMDEFRYNVAASLKQISNMSDEMSFIEKQQKDQRRINKNVNLLKLRDSIEPFVFPCANASSSSPIPQNLPARVE